MRAATQPMIPFTKMHGAGNDYIFVDCIQNSAPERPSELARRISDRRFGVGGDGLILILPSDCAEARMRMFNADGSEAEMCGNGIRCLAKYVYERGISSNPHPTIETGRGPLALDLLVEEGRVERVIVDMGAPILGADDIPTRLGADLVVDAELTVADRTLRATSVSMGNPHCVIYLERASDEWVLGVGPMIERDAHFPEGANVEFVEVQSPSEVFQRTWERGSGETWACGTGACAVCVAGVLTGRTERRILVHLRGGDLEVEWDQEAGHVFMTGPAEEVYSGTWPHD